MTDAVKTIHFNTGLRYTGDGQKISATLYDDGTVTIWDHSRMVDREFSGITPEDFHSQGVVDLYNSSAGVATLRSFTDGMTDGGANSVWEG